MADAIKIIYIPGTTGACDLADGWWYLGQLTSRELSRLILSVFKAQDSLLPLEIRELTPTSFSGFVARKTGGVAKWASC